MDLFTLAGKITIDATEANAAIDALIEKAGVLASTLNGGTPVTVQTGTTTGGTRPTSTTTPTQTTGGQPTTGTSKWEIVAGNVITQMFNKAWQVGKDFFKTGYDFNKEWEKNLTTFTTYMGGDVKAAEKLMDDLYTFAKETPLSLSETINVARHLMANGVSSEDVLWTLGMIGDVSNGDPAKMKGLAKALTDVKNIGTLKGQERMQFANRDVDLYGLLLDYYHSEEYAQSDHYDPIKARATREHLPGYQKEDFITYEDVLSALMMSVKTDGRYFEAMDNMMDTTYGKSEKLFDIYEQFAGKMTKGVINVFSNKTLPEMTDILNGLNDAASDGEESITNVATGISNIVTGGAGLLAGIAEAYLAFAGENPDAVPHTAIGIGSLLASLGGHPLIGGAISMAGVAALWDKYGAIKKETVEAETFASDVDLPFIKQQFEWQGNPAAYDAYYGAWMQKQIDAGYTEEQIAAYVENAFAEYVPYTDAQMRAAFGPYKGSDPSKHQTTWFDGVVESTKAILANLGLLRTTHDFVSTDPRDSDQMLWLMTGNPPISPDDVVPNGSGVNRNGHGGYLRRFPDVVVPTDDGASGMNNLPALVGAVQTLGAAVQSMVGEIPGAISSGIGNISVTGTITTGDVTLDGGAVVGQLAPRLDMKLGAVNARAARG